MWPVQQTVVIPLQLTLYVCVFTGSGPHAICVECSNGKKFYADVCLVTISLGYLKQHSARLFNPPLPDAKVEAIQRVAMGTCNKIILEFDGQVRPPVSVDLIESCLTYMIQCALGFSKVD